MIELSLRRTWYEISEHLGSLPKPLRIAELINRLAPRSWTFKTSFVSTGRIAVEIDCDPTGADDDALALLDGSPEEIFFADAICLRKAGQYFIAETSKLLDDPPPSNLIVLEHSSREAVSLLALEGFCRSTVAPRELQQGSTIRSYFLENTWLGSPEFEGSGHVVRWVMFGSSELIRPTSRYTKRLGRTPGFVAEAQLYDRNGGHIGHARFQTSESLKNDEVYTTFSPLLLEFPNGSVVKRRSHRWIVEIGGHPLRQAALEGGPTAGLIRELVGSLPEAMSSVLESSAFGSYAENVQRRQEAEAANGLRRRQERAQHADRVTFRGVPVMVAPSCENEVLALLCKLEALGALPFHEFRLWEYTSRVGIDALASYRVRDVDVPAQHAAVELEHHFENFFDHEHPHHQVNLVVCWDFRGDEPPSYLRQRHPWLFEYRNDESFNVLVLCRTPDLRIERR